MKFLCVPCDTAMQLKEARGPQEGSMSVFFACPACGNEIAMLTNAMETQMVRSLGVKIGGRTAQAAPMETVRATLAAQQPVFGTAIKPAETATASKCPFTGMVEEAVANTAGQLVWTAEAEARLTRIPSFVQPMVRKSIEQHTREQGYTEVTVDIMEEVKGRLNM